MYKHSKIVRQHILNGCFFKYLRRKSNGIHHTMQTRFEGGNKLHERHYHHAGEEWIIEETLLHPIDSTHAIAYTPDMRYEKFLIKELKFTKINPKYLPKPQDVRQAIFYASANRCDVLLKYYDFNDVFLLERSYTYDQTLLDQFKERAKIWFQEKENETEIYRDRGIRNPWPDECKYCEYRTGVCWNWLKAQK